MATTPSECAQNSKQTLEQQAQSALAKFGKAAYNDFVSLENGAISGIESILKTEANVLAPLLALDQIFLDSFIIYPFDIMDATIESTFGTIVGPVNSIGALASQCSDTRAAAKAITGTIGKWQKDLNQAKQWVDKLQLISGKAILKAIDNSINLLDYFKLTPIP